jgi:hypothetical protein
MKEKIHKKILRRKNPILSPQEEKKNKQDNSSPFTPEEEKLLKERLQSLGYLG